MNTGKNNFLEMVKGEEPDHIPFWFMRQAGRYLPEYKKLRASSSGFLDMAYTPKKACEVTLQPLRRFGMDAAIIFSDILVVPHALGQDLDFVEGEGPKLNPIKTPADISSLKFSGFESGLSPIYEALSLTRSSMKQEGFANKTLIGFCGAPWTLACYMIEGGGSKDFLRTKVFAYQHEQAFAELIDILVESSAQYLINQINAGAQAVQIFDSWAGILDAHSFAKWVSQPTRRIIELVRGEHPNVPIIGFPRMAGTHYLNYVRDTGVNVIGLDPLIDSAYVAKALQPQAVVQGNLDPAVLLAGGDALTLAAEKTIGDLKNGGFVFNLGHGINKDTPIEHVETLVKIIKKHGKLT